MKNNTTVICLTLIAIAGFLTNYGAVGLFLWIGYGLYKLDTHELHT